MSAEIPLRQEQDRRNDQLLTAKQTAEMLSCSPQHIMRMALLGSIPAIDLAEPHSKQRMWRFRRESILQWVEERERGKRGRIR